MTQEIYTFGSGPSAFLILQATRRTVKDENVKIIQRKDPERPDSTIVGMIKPTFNKLKKWYPDLYKFKDVPSLISLMDATNNYLAPALAGLDFKVVSEALSYSEFRDGIIEKSDKAGNDKGLTSKNRLQEFQRIWQLSIGANTVLRDRIKVPAPTFEVTDGDIADFPETTNQGKATEICGARELHFNDELDRQIISFHIKDMNMPNGKVDIPFGEYTSLQGFVVAKNHESGKAVSVSGLIIPNSEMMKKVRAKTKEEFKQKLIKKIIRRIVRAGIVFNSDPSECIKSIPDENLGGSTLGSQTIDFIPYDAHILDHAAIVRNGICIMFLGASGGTTFLQSSNRVLLAGLHGQNFSQIYSANHTVENLDDLLFQQSIEYIAASKVDSYTQFACAGEYAIQVQTPRGDKQAAELKEIVIELGTQWRNGKIQEHEVNQGIKKKLEEIREANQADDELQKQYNSLNIQ